jgi:hypothetical protein
MLLPRRSPSPAALLLLATAGLAGCAGRTYIALPERPPLPADAVRLVYVGGAARSLFRPDGRRCGPPPTLPVRGLLGWQSLDGEPLCLHDSYDHGQEAASLELHFRGAVSGEGALQLLSRGLTVNVVGRVRARGTPKVDVEASAHLELTARAPSCSATHLEPLGRAVVDGPWVRTAQFDGWIVLPDLLLQGCRAGEVLEVRLRLVGETTRGVVELDAFGLVAGRGDDLHDAFALRRRPDVAPEVTPGTPEPAPADGRQP